MKTVLYIGQLSKIIIDNFSQGYINLQAISGLYGTVESQKLPLLFNDLDYSDLFIKSMAHLGAQLIEVILTFPFMLRIILAMNITGLRGLHVSWF